MTMKLELTRWQEAIEAYERSDYVTSIRVLMDITSIGAKIYFNIGSIYFALSRYEDAAISYGNAVYKDKYFAVAHFQLGVSRWILKDYEAALESFTETIEYLRDNTCIDYRQLGLQYRLYAFEVLFNRGLCFLALGDVENARVDLDEAAGETVLPEHHHDRYRTPNVIKAYQEGKLDEYLPFVVPIGRLYKPPQLKVKTSKVSNGSIIKLKPDQPSTANPDNHKNSFMKYDSTLKSTPSGYQDIMSAGTMPTRYSNVTPGNTNTGFYITERRPSDDSQFSMDSSMSLRTSPTDKLKLKCYHGSDCRILIFPQSISHDQLLNRIRQKFNMDSVRLKYEDAEGDLILLGDQEDLDTALEGLIGTTYARLNLHIF